MDVNGGYLAMVTMMNFDGFLAFYAMPTWKSMKPAASSGLPTPVSLVVLRSDQQQQETAQISGG